MSSDDQNEDGGMDLEEVMLGTQPMVPTSTYELLAVQPMSMPAGVALYLAGEAEFVEDEEGDGGEDQWGFEQKNEEPMDASEGHIWEGVALKEGEEDHDGDVFQFTEEDDVSDDEQSFRDQLQEEIDQNYGEVAPREEETLEIFGLEVTDESELVLSCEKCGGDGDIGQISARRCDECGGDGAFRADLDEVIETVRVAVSLVVKSLRVFSNKLEDIFREAQDVSEAERADFRKRLMDELGKGDVEQMADLVKLYIESAVHANE